MFELQALDYLAIGIHELASISERRVERLINPGKLLALLKTNTIIESVLKCIHAYMALSKLS